VIDDHPNPTTRVSEADPIYYIAVNLGTITILKVSALIKTLPWLFDVCFY
jgi:hypothetical protein